jgi:hypothetical protein
LPSGVSASSLFWRGGVRGGGAGVGGRGGGHRAPQAASRRRRLGAARAPAARSSGRRRAAGRTSRGSCPEATQSLGPHLAEHGVVGEAPAHEVERPCLDLALQQRVQPPHLEAAAVESVEQHDGRRVAVAVVAAGRHEGGGQCGHGQGGHRNGRAHHALRHAASGGLIDFGQLWRHEGRGGHGGRLGGRADAIWVAGEERIGPGFGLGWGHQVAKRSALKAVRLPRRRAPQQVRSADSERQAIGMNFFQPYLHAPPAPTPRPQRCMGPGAHGTRRCALLYLELRALHRADALVKNACGV